MEDQALEKDNPGSASLIPLTRIKAFAECDYFNLLNNKKQEMREKREYKTRRDTV